MARRPSFTVASLEHCYWPPQDTERMPRPARLLRERWRAIAASISQAEPMEYVITRQRCWMKPERKPCPGTIVGNIAIDTDDIGWHCSVCGQGGVIHDWQGKPDDLSQAEVTPRATRMAATELAVRLTHPVYRLLERSVVFSLSADIHGMIASAERHDDGAIVRGRYAVLADLRSFVAQEANGHLLIEEEQAGRELIHPTPGGLTDLYYQAFHAINDIIAW